MPSAAARRLYEDQIPSFMSVFDLDAETMADRETVTVVDPKFIDMEQTCAPSFSSPQQHMRSGAIPQDPMHKHHDSTSTQTSESADSSPTTTLSTTDSSPLSDPSPSSSPDSPINLLPLSSFPGANFGGLPSTMSSLTVVETSNSERPTTSPSPRRPRNMKGLSIQPPFVGSISTSLVSEPTSPSFIKPNIPAMKRRPSNLSLKTNTSDLIMRNTLEVPGSPALPPILQRRALKHSTSTPHMLSGMKSSTFGPTGGMTFPKVLERNESGLSEVLRPMKLSVPGPRNSTIVEEDSPIRIQVASRGAIDNDQLRDESENNEDQKSPGYPEGPIAIYDDNVFLYLEPTAEEAAKFDVVMNVAREVKNPFQALAKSEIASAEEMQLVGDDSPMRDTTLPAATFAAAPELPQGEEPAAETPTTPKASFAPKLPEYIHMPWDHNTNIAVDLMSLCETIDKRTKEGKKVLIHCQQGASRSASLIIAYGLYRNPELSVNDAYYAAQAKSRWISPNMKLMYCLQDFQKELSKRKLTPASSAFRPRTGRSPSKHRLTLSADAIDIAPKEPRTAPLLSETDQGANSKPEDGCLRQCTVMEPPSQAISPGPSSAPSSFSWMEVDVCARDSGKLGCFDLGRTHLVPKSAKEPAVKTEAKPIALNLFAKPPPTPGFAPHSFDSHSGFGFSGLSFGHPMSRSFQDDLPRERQITIAKHFPDDSALMSPRAETMTNNPLRDVFGSGMGGMRFIESPPTPKEELFSPRTTMFPRDPFLPFGRPPQVADPRSPPTKGESPIVRSIDEIL